MTKTPNDGRPDMDTKDERAGELVRKTRGMTIILELKPVTDPLRRQGLPARDPTYRLKLALKRLLRDYGLECTSVRDGQGEPIGTDDEEPT